MSIDFQEWPQEAREALETFPEFEPLTFNDSGANSYVVLGRHSVLQRDVALKIYFHAPDEMAQEPALIASIDHENVMKVLDARSLKKGCSFFLTPYANYGDLASYIQGDPIPLPKAFRLLRQLLSGLSALHSDPVRIVHRDLKPQNLLVHDDTLLIADFGSVRQIAENAHEVPASKHSVLYRPPEAFGEDGRFNFSSDCYQAGVIGYLLFGGDLSEDLTDHLKTGQLKELDQMKYNNVSRADECAFVDDCLRMKIQKGKLLNWSSIPECVPRRIVRTLRRATSTNGRLQNVSEFLAELAAVGPVPDWTVEGPQTWALRAWNKQDYQLTLENGDAFVRKRRSGATKFMADNALCGGSMNDAFGRLRIKLGLP